MRALGFLIIVLGLAAGAAFMTKPSAADAEATLREQVTLAVAKQDLGEGRSTGENLGRVTISLGISRLSGEDSIRTLIDRADRALYHAKETGRNRVVNETALKVPNKNVA